MGCVKPTGRKRPRLTVKPSQKVYLKGVILRSIEEVDLLKKDVKSGKILIVKITPLAVKSINDALRAVDELREFAISIGGDIGRLGEERIVITPPSVRIWRRTEIAEGFIEGKGVRRRGEDNALDHS